MEEMIKAMSADKGIVSKGSKIISAEFESHRSLEITLRVACPCCGERLFIEVKKDLAGG